MTKQSLAELAAMTTVPEVVARFGTARRLSEEVLGRSVDGGATTKLVVRALGRLLQHRLGPCVAAEALSWALVVAEFDDNGAIVELLELACYSSLCYRPLDEVGRTTLREELARCPRPANRRDRLHELWSKRGSTTRLDEPPAELLRRIWIENDQPERTDDDRFLSTLLASGPDEQDFLISTASVREVRSVAGLTGLFDLSEGVIGRCLLQETSRVVAHRGCPLALREMVRFPYNYVTLVLAMRAGPAFFETASTKKRLELLSESERRGFLHSMPAEYLAALRGCGMLGLDDFLTNVVAARDTRSAQVADALFGSWPSYVWSMTPEDVIACAADVLVQHPRAADLVALNAASALADAPGWLWGCLRDEVPARVGILATAGLDPGGLRRANADAASVVGGRCAALCPGIAGKARPHFIVNESHPFWYPREIRSLVGSDYPEAPGWTVSLPEDEAELERNAEYMGNCTRGYAKAIREHRDFIVIVTSPTGVRFNAAIYLEHFGYLVHDIQGRFNYYRGGADWLFRALPTRIALCSTQVVSAA